MALLSGRLPVRTGMTTVFNAPTSTLGLDPDEILLPEALKARGYATAIVGKWHLGTLPAFLPTRNGFDSYFGIPYSNDKPPVRLYRDETVIEDPAIQETLTRRYTDEAVKFIRASKDRPFFLYVAHTFPHTPLASAPPFAGRSKGGLYGDTIEELDASVGEVMKALRETGVDRRTLVFFTSDNGPNLGASKKSGVVSTPFRGGKHTPYEGGLRVPGILRMPGRIPAGRVRDEPVAPFDLFPTCVALAGGRLPPDRPYDGVDLMPWLSGATKEPPGGREREILFYHDDHLRAFRSGRWKWLPSFTHPRQPERVFPEQLYDLETDPKETRNLLSEKPDVAKRLRERAWALHEEAKQGARPARVDPDYPYYEVFSEYPVTGPASPR